MDAHELEVRSGSRFDFGANWQRFLREIDETDVGLASEALLQSLEVDTLVGKSFLDVGSGSGLSSLAAYRAGACVVSFDFDPRSVECTEELRRRSMAGEAEWTVLRGSALDVEFLASLGEFDVVYSWGVLHHTGNMWAGLDHVTRRVAGGGQLLIALYNDQGWLSRYWLLVKKIYNRSGAHSWVILAIHAPYFIAARVAGNVRNALIGRARISRGMKFWRDMVDWLGGIPFEVADRSQVVSYVEARKFQLQNMKSAGRQHGCNEWVFRRHD